MGHWKENYGIILAGLSAGIVNGLFGAGGGMVLVPLLTILTDLDDSEIFPSSVSIILPVCIVSLTLSWKSGFTSWGQVLPYLFGSLAGGLAAGIWGKKLPTMWLHRMLGVLILWGGIRYLC